MPPKMRAVGNGVWVFGTLGLHFVSLSLTKTPQATVPAVAAPQLLIQAQNLRNLNLPQPQRFDSSALAPVFPGETGANAQTANVQWQKTKKISPTY